MEAPRTRCVGICNRKKQARDINYRMKIDKINMLEERPDD
jgi:hypothetical protein